MQLNISTKRQRQQSALGNQLNSDRSSPNQQVKQDGHTSNWLNNLVPVSIMPILGQSNWHTTHTDRRIMPFSHSQLFEQAKVLCQHSAWLEKRSPGGTIRTPCVGSMAETFQRTKTSGLPSTRFQGSWESHALYRLSAHVQDRACVNTYTFALALPRSISYAVVVSVSILPTPLVWSRVSSQLRRGSPSYNSTNS